MEDWFDKHMIVSGGTKEQNEALKAALKKKFDKDADKFVKLDKPATD